MNNAVSEKELKKREFILNGNIWKVMISISLPLFLYSIFQYLYTFVDVLMASQIDKTASTAVSSIGAITNMISSLGGGIAAGGSIMIARAIGKNDYKKAKTLSNSLFCLVFIISIVINIIFLPFAKPIMAAFGVPNSSIETGLNYFIINIVNCSLIMFNDLFIGTQKAKGTTKLISVFNVLVILVKLGLSCMFVYGFELNDITFIGLSTLISNAVLFLIIIFGFMLNKSYVFNFSIKDIDLGGKNLKKITFISFPIFLGKFIFFFGKVIINSMAKGYEDNVVGALGVSNSIGGMATKGLSAVEDSTSSVISQNLGNGNVNRAISTFVVGLCYNLIISVVGVLLVSIFNDQIVGLYANGDVEYGQMISEIFFFEKMGIITLGINSAVLGLLYGFGYTRLSMVINIMRVFLFRVPSLFFMQTILPNWGVDLGWKSVGIAMGFSNIMIGIVALITAIVVIIHIKKKEKEKESARMLTQVQKDKTEKFIHSYLDNYTFYKKDKKIYWCYEDGIVLNGAYQMYLATKDSYYLDFIENHLAKCIDLEGNIASYTPEEKNIDNVEEAWALYNINQIRHHHEYDLALKQLVHQLEIQPRTSCGSFWHKDIYPYQIWLDGLFMGLPFYSLIANENHSIKMKKDIVQQFKNVEEYNWDPEQKVFMHCYDETKSMQWADKETGRSPNVWLRSVGWLAMASADCYEIFKASSGYPTSYFKKFLIKVLTSMEPFQDQASHLYYDLPLLPNEKGNYLEMSGSLMLAYGYIKGARLKMISHDQLIKGTTMLESIIENYLSEKELSNICRVSGLDSNKRDGSVAYYLSEENCVNDTKGVAPLMMCYAEYLRACK